MRGNIQGAVDDAETNRYGSEDVMEFRHNCRMGMFLECSMV